MLTIIHDFSNLACWLPVIRVNVMIFICDGGDVIFYLLT